jgi:hypothetical protein
MFLVFAVITTLVFAVLPAASASPTLTNPIKDISINEDLPAYNKLNLNNHFSNGETELSFSFISSDNKIHIKINDDRSVDFSTPKDWFGAEEITFIASDGVQEVSDSLTVSVEPVNDAPLIISPLPNTVSFDEDHVFLGAINLYEHFQDIDSILTLSYSSENIIVKINEDGSVDLSAPMNWYGSENVVFYASDGELEISDSVLVTVNPVNDQPIRIMDLKSISLNEKSHSSTVELGKMFSDYEDNILSFQVSGNSHIKYKIDQQNGQLRIQAPEGWRGKELLTVTASDSQGASQSTQFVVISTRNSDLSSGPIFYFTGLILALALAGVRLQVAGRRRQIKSPVKLESYRHFKGR